MIRFSCPNCEKGLRAEDSNAGSAVKCPGCGQKLTIPDAEIEQPPGDAEPERPAPRKKKRPRFRPKSLKLSSGKTLVIIICCIVLGMHLVSLINYLASPDPVALAKQQSREVYQKMGKDVPKDFEEKWEQSFHLKVGGKDMDLLADIRRSQMISLIWVVSYFCLSAVLLIFLYLRHDWARVVLGVLFLIGAGLGIFGIVFGGLAALHYLGGGAAFLAVLDMLFHLMVSLVIGLALLKSESIQAYTTG